jgi:hypothetical protein
MAALLCIILLSAIVVTILFVATGLSDQIYNSNHLIPDPAIRGDDIGQGLIVVFSAIASLFFSIPVCFYFGGRLFRFVIKKLGCKDGISE